MEACVAAKGKGRTSFLKKRSKKLLTFSASASPDRASSKSQKFFAAFFQKSSLSSTRRNSRATPASQCDVI
jgi:hypothetical protein